MSGTWTCGRCGGPNQPEAPRCAFCDFVPEGHQVVGDPLDLPPIHETIPEPPRGSTWVLGLVVVVVAVVLAVAGGVVAVRGAKRFADSGPGPTADAYLREAARPGQEDRAWHRLCAAQQGRIPEARFADEAAYRRPNRPELHRTGEPLPTGDGTGSVVALYRVVGSSEVLQVRLVDEGSWKVCATDGPTSVPGSLTGLAGLGG